MEQEPKQSGAATTSDFVAPRQRRRFVDSFEREGIRYVVVSEEPAQLASLLALTRRERQIVGEAAAGCSNRQIAQRLGISHATVRVLMARAANRLGVRTRKALLAHPALQEQGSTGAEANPTTPALAAGGLELPEQAVLSTRTGTEK